MLCGQIQVIFVMKLPTKDIIPVLMATMALLPKASSYTVSLFHAKGCSYEDVGAECGDIDELTCCAAPAGQLFVSVGQDGNWGYSSQNGDACGVILGSNNGCFSVENGLDVISGGSVVGIVRQAAVAARSEQRKVVTADTWFYRNETAKYTLAIDSDAGREYAALEDRDAQVMFITTHGAFSVMKA
jgi:hypothetical protein